MCLRTLFFGALWIDDPFFFRQVKQGDNDQSVRYEAQISRELQLQGLHSWWSVSRLLQVLSVKILWSNRVPCAVRTDVTIHKNLAK